MKKRLLAMLMVLSMALSILPMSAMAAPDGDEEAGKKQAEAQISGGTSAEYYTYDGESWSEKGETSPEVKNNEENPKVTVSKQIRPTGTENQFDIALKVEAMFLRPCITVRHADRLWEDTMIGTVKEKPQDWTRQRAPQRNF